MTPECRYCLGPCDDSHDASVRIHAYLKARIARVLGEHVDTEPRPSKPHRQPPAIRVEWPAVDPQPVRVKGKRKRTPRFNKQRILDMHRAGVPAEEIATKLGCTTDTVYGHIRKEEGARRGGLKRAEVKPGDKHGQLTVIEEAATCKHKRQLRCICVCGKVEVYSLWQVLLSRRISCGCTTRHARCSPEKVTEAKRLRREGKSYREIEETLGIKRSTAQKYIALEDKAA